VKARRHSSALRESEDEKKAGRRAVLRGADCGLRLVGVVGAPGFDNIATSSRRWSVSRSARRRLRQAQWSSRGGYSSGS